MLVREGYDALRKLMKEGHGNVELVASHGGSGVSYEVSIGNYIREKEEHEDVGVLCEWENGRPWAPIYLD